MHLALRDPLNFHAHFFLLASFAHENALLHCIVIVDGKMSLVSFPQAFQNINQQYQCLIFLRKLQDRYLLNNQRYLDCTLELTTFMCITTNFLHVNSLTWQSSVCCWRVITHSTSRFRTTTTVPAAAIVGAPFAPTSVYWG